MGNGAWAECAGTFAEADLYGQECYAGLDLSSTSDISSVCYAFPVGKKIMLVSRHYLPEFQLQNPANKKPRHLSPVGKGGLDTHNTG